MRDGTGLLEELLAQRRGSLLGYARLYVGDPAAAEDLLHDALVKVFSRPRTLSNVPQAEEYVRQAVRTRFLDDLRRARVRGRQAHLVATPHAAADELGAVDARVDVFAALTVLSDRERACVVLRYLDDQSTSSTAQALGVSEGSVKRYVSDGIAKLRSLMKGVAFDEPDERVSVLRIEEKSA